MKWKNIAIAIVVFLSVNQSAIEAELVTFDFRGVVTDELSNSIGGVRVGDDVRGSFTFDTAIQDSDNDPHAGRFVNALTSFRATFGPYPVSLYHDLSRTITTKNDRLVQDQGASYVFDSFGFTVYVNDGAHLLDIGWGEAIFTSEGRLPTLMSSTALPLAPPNIIFWPRHRVINGQCCSGFLFRLTELTLPTCAVEGLETTPPHPTQLPYDIKALNEDLQTAILKFQDKIIGEPGRQEFRPTSGLRSTEYQRHLYELNTKRNDILDKPNQLGIITVSNRKELYYAETKPSHRNRRRSESGVIIGHLRQ
ncbi:MAG: hypothetical protein IID44_12455 [Planctomycetes bacterium]|nr:hypothetical protein [Planctomycetota bacterium]